MHASAPNGREICYATAVFTQDTGSCSGSCSIQFWVSYDDPTPGATTTQIPTPTSSIPTFTPTPGVPTATPTPDGGGPNTPTPTPIFTVNLTAHSLFGIVSENDEETIGAYVHFNLDNDNESGGGTTKHPGGDYLESETVVNEDDLKLLQMAVTPYTFFFFFFLTITSSNASIWSSVTKGNGNMILSGVGSQSWNLTIESERNEFYSMCNTGIYVEGINSGDADIVLQHYGDSGKFISVDTITYHFVAADCGRQPTIQDRRNLQASLGGAFPLVGCEYSILDQPGVFNCIGWSVDQLDIFRSWDIDIIYGDGNGIFTNVEMDNFYLQEKGWTNWSIPPVTAESMYYPFPEPWNYVNDPEEPPSPGYHAARNAEKSPNFPCDCSQIWVMYQSKLGPNGPLIEHRWNQVNGSNYGQPDRFYF